MSLLKSSKKLYSPVIIVDLVFLMKINYSVTPHYIFGIDFIVGDLYDSLDTSEVSGSVSYRWRTSGSCCILKYHRDTAILNE